MWLKLLLHFNTPTMIISLFNKLFDDVSGKLEYPHLGSSESCWILVTDRNTVSVIIGSTFISTRIISWGTDALLLTMRAVIETKGLSKLEYWSLIGIAPWWLLGQLPSPPELYQGALLLACVYNSLWVTSYWKHRLYQDIPHDTKYFVWRYQVWVHHLLCEERHLWML